MTEFVYQVRVGEGYGEMFLRHNDEWEFENFKDAIECLTNNLEFQKDYIRITRTPKLCEDECEEKYDKGYEEGIEDGYKEGHQIGYDEGTEETYHKAFEEGRAYEAGLDVEDMERRESGFDPRDYDEYYD